MANYNTIETRKARQKGIEDRWGCTHCKPHRGENGCRDHSKWGRPGKDKK